MPTQPKPQITQVSFSRLKDYRKCPQFAKFKHIQKLKEPGNAAMDRGMAIGKAADSAARPGGKITPDLKNFSKEFKALQKEHIFAEPQWALDKNWQPTTYFAPNVFVRMLIDCGYIKNGGKVGIIIDYKTGKEYPDHEEQLKLYALAGFNYWPEVVEINASMWYLDSGTTMDRTYTRADIPELEAYWTKQFKAILADRRFAPTPGRQCGYCHFRKPNGGPCEY